MAKPTIVLLPSWGSGHFMSALEAGKRLVVSGSSAISLTVLVMLAPTETKSSEVDDHVRRESAANPGLDIQFRRLPVVEHPTGCSETAEDFTSRYVQLHAPHVKGAIAALTSPVAAVVIDLFFTPLLDAVAHELSLPSYFYFASTAAFLSLMLRHELTTSSGFADLEGSAVDAVPGLPPLPPSNIPVCLAPRKNYDWFEYHGRRFAEAKGVIVNSSVDLECAVLAAIPPNPPIHPIGPVIWFNNENLPSPPPQQHECVRWLDAQPGGSVVYLCFGSIGYHEASQAREIAAGLERSNHRFLWILRGAPTSGVRYPTDANLGDLLPPGFTESTSGRGMVWPRWAPQKEILAHASIGGFMTHCGWNSALESMWFGVPMAAWPLYGEQHLNAFELVESMGVAIEVKRGRRNNTGSFVEGAEVERVVRRLMMTPGGGEVGRKAREMRDACRKAVEEEGGSSRAAMQRLVREIVGRIE
uniref:Glycosyltransferase n=1 Tax=Leersia perrieri TaxID=77586 RepID=A0A0D9X0D3_9ORYZ